MNRTKILRSLTMLIFLGSLLTLAAVGLPSYVRWVVAALLAVSGYAFYELERRRLQCTHDERLVQTVNHHRHDWMNDFQVLLGLLKLKKYDSMQPYMDNIRVRMHQESCMAKLGSSSLIAYLMSFRTKRRPLELEMCVEQEINLAELSVGADQVVEVLQSTVEHYCRCAEETDGEPNQLSIELGVEMEDLLLDCVYSGGYRVDKLREAVSELRRKCGSRAHLEAELDEDKAVLTFRFPNVLVRDRCDAAG
ncbi:Spo0B domain-containing protein [Paenibacillus sp. J2TS4]|uniref:Spo0B domain-containing protein n=1 Tax=Paenibacillus sp. J2TS4 TaxID=2807194 RepID=UPI001AFF575F|nr:Spo0B domain-containing protein [Paenibacillus sp. J2TS4]GIP31377.1 hypothetical protein J2TS4_05870 [Paenibacillus sp. J2TS4]